MRDIARLSGTELIEQPNPERKFENTGIMNFYVVYSEFFFI